MQLKANKRFVGKKCPFCQETLRLGEEIQVCDFCKVPHHLTCWQENEGCSTYGCTDSGSGKPGEADIVITPKELSGVSPLPSSRNYGSSVSPRAICCQSCGAENDSNAQRCVKCGRSLPQSLQPAQKSVGNVPTHLAEAIVVTLLCCLPFGIVAIVYAAQVNTKLQAGNYAGALEASNMAKTWCWVSFGVGLLLCVIYALGSLG